MSVKIAPTPVQPSPESSPRRRLSPGLVAWLVLLFSFGVFCVLIYTAYSLVTDFLSHSVQNQTGTVRLVKDQDDNVLVLHSGQTKETRVNIREDVSSGDEIRTDKSSTARLTLFDNSYLDLTPGSRVRLDTLQVDIKKFRVSQKRIVITVLDGVVRFSSAPLRPYNEADVKVLFPSEVAGVPPVEMTAVSDIGGATNTYSFSVSRASDSGLRAALDNQSRRAVAVSDGKRAVTVEPGQRVTLVGGQIGQPGRPGENPEDLIVNGSFINGIDSWKDQYFQGGDKGQINGVINFDAELVEDGVQPRAHIFRLDPRAADDNAETSLLQEVNHDVSTYSELWFSLHVKLQYQNLAGGGQQGIEYPVFVKIAYMDVNGQRQELFHGFYSLAADSHTQTQDGLGRSSKLAQAEWQEWRVNLMDNRNRPARILQIEVGSSGHLYDSYFSDVSLIAR